VLVREVESGFEEEHEASKEGRPLAVSGKTSTAPEGNSPLVLTRRSDGEKTLNQEFVVRGSGYEFTAHVGEKRHAGRSKSTADGVGKVGGKYPPKTLVELQKSIAAVLHNGHRASRRQRGNG